MTTPGRPLDQQAVATVAAALFSPLATSWKPGETLSVLPDGFLQDVPWGALPLPSVFGSSAGKLALKFGPIVETRIDRAGSRSSHSQSMADLSLLAVGCDQAGSEGSALKQLRRAELEARRITESWPGRNTTLRVGEQASWGNLAALDLKDLRRSLKW